MLKVSGSSCKCSLRLYVFEAEQGVSLSESFYFETRSGFSVVPLGGEVALRQSCHVTSYSADTAPGSGSQCKIRAPHGSTKLDKYKSDPDCTCGEAW